MQTVKVEVGALRTNCYIVYDEHTKRGFIIDPGAEALRICAEVEKLNVHPEAIVLTHGHFDHIMGIDGVKDIFEDIPVYASAKEVELLADPSLNSSERIRKPYSVEPEHTVNDGESFEIAGIRLKGLFTPGHTVGSMCLYIEDSGVLFSGDTLFNGGYGRTDLPTGDTAALMDSLGRVLAVLPKETVVYPGHGPKTDIGKEYGNDRY